MKEQYEYEIPLDLGGRALVGDLPLLQILVP